MSNAVALHLSVDADTSDAVSAFDQVGAAAKGMSDDVDRAAADAGAGMSSFNDSADGAGSAAATAAGAFGDLGGALATVPGPIGAIGAQMETIAPMIQGVTGATDLLTLATQSELLVKVRSTAATVAHGVATVATSAATKAWAATQWLLNAAMSANPIGLIIILIVALVAAVIIAYQKSDTFRAIVQKLGEVAVAAFTSIWETIQVVVSWLADKLGPAFTAVKAVMKTQIDLIVGFVGLILSTVQTVAAGIFGPVDTAWGKVKNLFTWDPGPTLTKAWNGILAILKWPFEEAWKTISGIFGADGLIAGIGATAVTGMTSAFQKVIDIINKLIRAFNSFPGPDISEISLNASSSRTVGSPAGVGVSTRTVGGIPVTSGGVVINIHGAIDPYETAQQIRRILARGAVIAGKTTP